MFDKTKKNNEGCTISILPIPNKVQHLFSKPRSSGPVPCIRHEWMSGWVRHEHKKSCSSCNFANSKTQVLQQNQNQPTLYFFPPNNSTEILIYMRDRDLKTFCALTKGFGSKSWVKTYLMNTAMWAGRDFNNSRSWNWPYIWSNTKR